MEAQAETVAAPADQFGAIFERILEALRPEPQLLVSEWSDEHRILSAVASAEPGRWRTERTPYLRKPMDCLSVHHPARRVVIMAGAQVGKTECGNNWVAYIIHNAPAPTLYVEPTVEVGKRVSKQRIAPMLLDTPALHGRVKESRSRDSNNTTMLKQFDGGVLIITGANSAAGLRSMPVRDLFLDEVDAYPPDVDGEGDPVSLAEKRTSTFARRKIFLVSTPTIKGLSRIEAEYLATDQQRYYLPCPECGHFDYLVWTDPLHHRIEWDEGQPDTARMVCSSCEARVSENYKTQMLLRGEWRATAEAKNPRAVGFHISALYSPAGWKSWGECAAEFLESKDNKQRLQTWINTVLGETYEDRGEGVAPEALLGRREQYQSEWDVPDGVGALVCSVDVQGDRLEAKITGYGAGEESWTIAHTQLFGDPGLENVWHDLTTFRTQPWKHQSGQEVRVEITVIDSGGLHSEHVHRYCRAFAFQRVFAIKGGSVQGAPLVSRPSKSNRFRNRMFVLGTDTGKDIVYSRLRIQSPGPGYMHLPEWADKEYVDQLTSETRVFEYHKGRGVSRRYVKLRERNEVLDLEVYALAALHVRGLAFVRDLSNRAQRWAKRVDAPPSVDDDATAQAAAPAPRARPRRKGWLSDF